MSQSTANELKHHNRFEYCQNRLKYRDGKNATAVKVYTVANESKHLLVFGVPKINLQAEVKREFNKIGPVTLVASVTNEIARKVELELFTDCYHVVYNKLYNARKAKKFLDAKSFYGGILHVSYAPEYETIEDVVEKFKQRKDEVQYRIRINKKRNSQENAIENNTRKRKISEEIDHNKHDKKVKGI